MQVNLGSGDRYAPGWINVDHQGCPHQKDMTLDIRALLPWGEGELKRVFMGHVLEHLRVYEVVDVLRHLRPCVAVGGEVMIIGPDCQKAEGMAVAGTLDVTLDSLRYGADRWSGDVHRWECEPVSMTTLLRAAGWNETITHTGIDDVAEMWPVADRGPQWQFGLHIVKE